MEKKHTGSMAFPFVLPPNDEPYEIDGFAINAGRLAVSVGMTLRDYFAAEALKPVYADAMVEYRHGSGLLEDPDWRFGIALDAYKMADAMLRAREAV